MTPTDELQVPHFEEALLARLQSRQQAGDYKQSRRRPPRRLVLVGAAAASVAVLGALVILQGDGRPERDRTGSPSEVTPPDSELAAKVVAAMDAADDTSVIHIRNAMSGDEL